jgi:hypothetical protein
MCVSNKIKAFHTANGKRTFDTALRKERKNEYFPNEKNTKMLQLLSKNFEDRFADFHRIKNEIRLFENPFTVEVSTAPDDL